MQVLQQSGFKPVAKNMSFQLSRNIPVDSPDIRQPAAQHDDIGVDDVDDHRKRPAQPVFKAPERGIGGGIASIGKRHDFRGLRSVTGGYRIASRSCTGTG